MIRKKNGTEKICPACGKTFHCHAAVIASCKCRELELKEELRLAVSSRYDDCLCTECLLRLAEAREGRDNEDG